MSDDRRDKAKELGRWRDMILSPQGPEDHEGTLVAVGIAKFININSLTTTVGIHKLHLATKLSEHTVRRRIPKLIEAGYLCGERAGKGRAWAARTLGIRWPASQATHETQGRPPRPAMAAPMGGPPGPNGWPPRPPNSSLNSYLPSQPFPPSGKGGSADAGNGSGAKKPREAGTNPRAKGTNPRANGKAPRTPERQSLAAWKTLIRAVDHVRSTPGATWELAIEQVDEPTRRAVEQMPGGFKSIADRTTYNMKALSCRFRDAYERAANQMSTSQREST